jgi:threonylcarbamoyladenosine tRNA methylthiotransferase MtaB
LVITEKPLAKISLNLLKALEKVEGLHRLRLGSIEPNLLKDEIIELVAGSKVIMPHFHIPLQSGSDEVLSLMKRKYSTGLFAKRIHKSANWCRTLLLALM